jgi:hypothetical protein
MMTSDENPKIVSQRNLERMLTGQRLLLARAAFKKKRVVVWRCHDFRTVTSGKHNYPMPLSHELLQTINSLPANKTGDMSTYQFFFEGIETSFLYVKKPSIATGQIHNNTCIGVALHLDPREPDDDPSKPFRVLK